MHVLKAALGPLASLRLTVVLFALSMVLILGGTLAQVHEGVWSVVDRYFRSPLVWIEPQLFVPRSMLRIPGALPFPGGLTLGVLLFVNLVAAHAVRFKLRAKRAGIILAHAGVLLLLVGEFVTGAAADEGNMTIDEGSSSCYVEDARSVELAVIDASDPREDLVVVVPQRLLAGAGGAITHGLLPFEVRVDEWMPNSGMLGPNQATPAQLARADAGVGPSLAAVPVPPATGVDGATVDLPSAYVTLTRGGERLGTYLLSAYLVRPQEVSVGGGRYGIQLRFRRTYKPYRLDLIDFKHDTFVGTDRPRNFSSLVRLVDPSRNVDRRVLIWMNHPLRHAGETFYQAAFKPDDSGTILQVVRNPGWLLPYVSCSMVTLGVLLHFCVRLAPSIRRRAA